jgi:predicted Holliday junction resolvase-like endonuclease
MFELLACLLAFSFIGGFIYLGYLWRQTVRLKSELDRTQDTIATLREEAKWYLTTHNEDFNTIAELKRTRAAEITAAREDAVKKSRAVLQGFAFEAYLPFIQTDFNPRDFRFFGDPIDFVVFDGLSDMIEGRASTLRGIYLVEVKSGNATLSTRQRAIRDACKDMKVSFKVYEERKLIKDSKESQL